MTDDFDERKWFFERSADKTIVSRQIKNDESAEPVRIASRVVDGKPGLQFALIKDEVVLRETPAGRYAIKATFLEDDRSIQTLTIQRFSSKTGPMDRQHFSFVGEEIDTFIEFLIGIRNIPLNNSHKLKISDSDLREMIIDAHQMRRIFSNNKDLFWQIAQQEDAARDLIAIGYRRNQLNKFKSLLYDVDFFAEEQKKLACRPEDVWQKFFEKNTWIFGYGLAYQFLSNLDDRKLEQIIRGRDLVGAGKRTDGLMKTRGILGSLCFVEIKRHDTPLLGSTQYRPDVWAPSAELVGGVSQVQATVHAAIETLGTRFVPRDHTGDPTGEELFNFEPRSCLVVGSLGQFESEYGINITKFRSFELFRRNTWRPEIVTFDELLERARFIVEHNSQSSDFSVFDSGEI